MSDVLQSEISNFTEIFKSFWTSLLNPQKLGLIGSKVFQIGLLVFLSQIFLRFGNVIIDKTIGIKVKRKHKMSEGHINTLNQLLKSSLKYAIYFFLITMLLSLIGIPVGSLLAGAGIIGLAIGFGAQSLVKDVISGFFILLENQFSVGDFIKTAGVEGVVMEVGLRTSKIRSFSGEIHILSNGSIQPVTNYSRNKMRIRISIPVSYEENIERIFKILQEVCDEVSKDNKNIVEPLKVSGITGFNDHGLDVALVGHSLPMNQWGIERTLRLAVKKRFDRENIRMPYPGRLVVSETIYKNSGPEE